MSYYIHSVPGRLRVKSPSVKGNAALAEEVREGLSAMEGVGTVTVNIVTGSIVVTYDKSVVSAEEIIGSLEQGGHFEESLAVTHAQYINDAASRAGRTIGRVLMGAAVEKAFEGSALSLIALLI